MAYLWFSFVFLAVGAILRVVVKFGVSYKFVFVFHFSPITLLNPFRTKTITKKGKVKTKSLAKSHSVIF